MREGPQAPERKSPALWPGFGSCGTGLEREADTRTKHGGLFHVAGVGAGEYGRVVGLHEDLFIKDVATVQHEVPLIGAQTQAQVHLGEAVDNIEGVIVTGGLERVTVVRFTTGEELKVPHRVAVVEVE